MKHKGFTLTELVVTLAILGIIASISVPSFAALHQNIKSETTVRNWVQFLNYGRSAATSNQSVITVCAIDENSCTNEFKNEWVMFTDNNKNKTIDSDEIIIRQFSPTDSLAIKIYPSNRTFFRFYDQPTGIYSGLMSSVSLCPTGQVDQHAAHIKINIMGRISTSKYKNENNVTQRMSNGKLEAVTCS